MDKMNSLRVTRGQVVAGLGLVALTVAAYFYLPSGIDWRLTFRPASLAVLSGRSPYSVEIFGLPPWGLIPFLPLALLPEQMGRAMIFTASLLAFAVAARRLGAGPAALAAFLASPPVVHSLLNANVDWLPILGFVLPPQIGLFFVTVKPQVGMGVAVFWLVEAWRAGGWRQVVRVFWPVTLALALSLAVFGLWPLRSMFVYTSSQGWNASLWPASLPVGLTLFVAALRRRRMQYAMAAGPCLSPYVLFHAWSGALVALAGATTEMVTAVAGLWALILIRAVSGAG
jgi:hypothetical protein